jgi:hypothetical protein
VTEKAKIFTWLNSSNRGGVQRMHLADAEQALTTGIYILNCGDLGFAGDMKGN